MYQVDAGNKSIKASFSARLENIDRLMKKLRLVLRGANLEGSSFACELVARETLNNAVRHGCGSDSSKTVKCSFQIRKGSIVMRVSDEGEGFNWRDYIIREARSLDTSGWGLTILRTYASEVSFNEKGNEVMLKIPVKRAYAVG